MAAAEWQLRKLRKCQEKTLETGLDFSLCFVFVYVLMWFSPTYIVTLHNFFLIHVALHMTKEKRQRT